MNRFLKELTAEELNIFKKLNSPEKVQDFVDSIPFNFEKNGETLFSPKRVLRERKAHCLEGALLSSAILLFHGARALLLDLKALKPDDSHVVSLFKKGNRWGAISKTNHVVLRYRDPVYKNPRELAMSYFNEYFLDDGTKTLESFAVFDLAKIKTNWIVDEKDLWEVEMSLEKTPRENIVRDRKVLRKTDPIEREVMSKKVWKK